MNPFTYSYPVKVYFGEKAAGKNLAAELAKVGPNVLLAYSAIPRQRPYLTDTQIEKLVVLDLKAQAWFDERNIRDQHGGGYFAHDEAIMGWLFGEHGIGDTQNDT